MCVPGCTLLVPALAWKDDRWVSTVLPAIRGRATRDLPSQAHLLSSSCSWHHMETTPVLEFRPLSRYKRGKARVAAVASPLGWYGVSEFQDQTI